jgi:dihydroorotate dehydrogenase
MTSDNFYPWFPHLPPIYDIKKTYEENAAFGPFFDQTVPLRTFPPEREWIDFLGVKVASPIGVAAGPLLNSKWIALSAALGFDIVTYKTIRSRAHPAHPLPNMIYVQREATRARQITTPAHDIAHLGVTNSFGMPSKSAEFLMEDIPRAEASLQRGQAMIVSVVGSTHHQKSFLEDFIDAALLAKNAGAKIIEANFSCPNVDKTAGCLYMTSETILEMGRQIVQAVHPIPVIIKMGLFPSLQAMRSSLVAAAKAGFRAIHGINTISSEVIDEKGNPALGKTRLTAGICGGQIRKEALQFIQDAAKIKKEEKLDLTILGVGGITLPEHFNLFLENGANSAMTATGMMWDPYLATRYHAKRTNHAQTNIN